MSNAPRCPYCEASSELVSGEVIYPHRPDLFQKFFYLCRPCWAYVGCHGSSINPLGVPANAELRQVRSKTHLVFDKLWRARGAVMTRKDAYLWLGETLSLNQDDAHIGKFDEVQCALTRALVNAKLSS